MEDYNNMVMDETVTENENVEETTEVVQDQAQQTAEPVKKTYTEEEVNEIVGKRLARNTAKIHKEYEQKYGALENVLRAGTGKEDVTEITDTFRDYYTQKGIQIPSEPIYSGRDIEVLARAEAEDIINLGFDEVVEEVDRLMKVGVENMSPREKAVFAELAEYRRNTERGKELSKIGVTEEVYESKAFKDFASKFSSGTPITEIYDIFNKMQPKKEYQTMGSMKGGQESKVKDYYTPEEIARLTEADLDNEEVWKAVRRSMTGKA